MHRDRNFLPSRFNNCRVVLLFFVWFFLFVLFFIFVTAIVRFFFVAVCSLLLLWLLLLCETRASTSRLVRFICTISRFNHFWCNSNGKIQNGSSIWTEISSMDKKMTDRKAIVMTKTGWNRPSHHISVPNSAKVRTKENGNSVNHIITNRTE